MNYEEMSDFEINSAVHNAINNLGFSMEFLGCDRIKWSRKGEQAILTNKVEYSKSGLSDYCNNPSDAWPIITANKIAVLPWNNSEWQSFLSLGGAEGVRFRTIHGRPLRAAMIVFLMMQEQAK